MKTSNIAIALANNLVSPECLQEILDLIATKCGHEIEEIECEIREILNEHGIKTLA